MVRVCLLALVASSFAFGISTAPAQPPREPTPVVEPKFVDDDKVYERFFDKLEALAKNKKPLAHAKLIAQLKSRPAGITPAKPNEKVLSPEEIYKTALPSVFIVGSMYPDKKGDWEIGTYATAWVLAPDGVLVTCWHVFEDLKKGEVFCAADRAGNVYPLTEFLGGDKTADVAVFRIDAKNLTPLPVSQTYPEVGSWVGLLSHPGDLFFMFTQGHVTRYSTNKNDAGKVEKWMGVTTEYASGSSGGPILNKYGAVVGIACVTISLESPDGPVNANRRTKAIGVPLKQSRQDKPMAKAQPKPAPKTTQDMVVKEVVPGPLVLKWVGK
ncbi:MAG: serine protease [Planctomycetia bacterium]|nr:serine protease [Planctomycetia bacterium]